MISLVDIATARLVVGVDTHKDEHVAVAIDQLGVRLGEHRLATSTWGYAGLERWASGHGDVQGASGSRARGPTARGSLGSWQAVDMP